MVSLRGGVVDYDRSDSFTVVLVDVTNGRHCLGLIRDGETCCLKSSSSCITKSHGSNNKFTNEGAEEEGDVVLLVRKTSNTGFTKCTLPAD